MDTAIARFESARLFSLGYLARTCLRWKKWTVCEPQSKMEDLFSIFSADQLTDDYCDALVQPLANIVLWCVALFCLLSRLIWKCLGENF